MDVLKKVPVREQDPKVRATNFEEVCLGYNEEEAMEDPLAAFSVKIRNAWLAAPYPLTYRDLFRK